MLGLALFCFVLLATGVFCLFLGFFIVLIQNFFFGFALCVCSIYFFSFGGILYRGWTKREKSSSTWEIRSRCGKEGYNLLPYTTGMLFTSSNVVIVSIIGIYEYWLASRQKKISLVRPLFFLVCSTTAATWLAGARVRGYVYRYEYVNLTSRVCWKQRHTT